MTDTFLPPPNDRGLGSQSSGLIASIVDSIRAGDRTAVEVVEHYLAAADADDTGINAFVTRTVEQALETAASIDRDGPRDLPLLGVPFTVKDTIQTRGVETTAGSLLLAGNIPEVDAPAVAGLRRAGAVMVGKSNCPEFAMDINTANRVAGVTRNPVDPSRTSGGSSGGDSAAVAAGFSAFGLGTDYGGSVRWPAHCTGVAAIRPTVGLIPSAGLLPNASPHSSKPMNSISVRGLAHTPGLIAPTVADLTILFSVVGGDRAAAQPPGSALEGLGIAWFDGDGNIPVREDLVAAVAEAASNISSSGARVEHRRPPGIERAAATLREMRDADGLVDVKRLASGREDQLADTTRGWLASAREATVTELQDLATRRDALRAEAEGFMADWPIWLLPVATIPAFELDPTDPSLAQPSFDVDGFSQARYEIMSPCWAIALYGFPSVVVPCGRSREGLPIGLQVVGPPLSDRTVLEIAAAIEASAREHIDKAN